MDMNCQKNLQNFMQKDLTEVKIGLFRKVLMRGREGATFLKHPVYVLLLVLFNCNYYFIMKCVVVELP